MDRNITKSIISRQMGFRQSHKFGQTVMHKKLSCVRQIQQSIITERFLCVKFLPDCKTVVAGSSLGRIFAYNLPNFSEVCMIDAHRYVVTYLEPSRDGSLLISIGSYIKIPAALWSFTDNKFEEKLRLEENYLQFGKTGQDKMVGALGRIATLYDVGTGTPLRQFLPEVRLRVGDSERNLPTFDNTDNLVLFSGVLFDIRISQPVGLLDSTAPFLNCHFHPNGYHILSDKAVWDIRTLRILRTIKVLNDFKIQFSPLHDVIYGYAGCSILRYYKYFIRTVDSTNYNIIGNFTAKASISDIGINKYGDQIVMALVTHPRIHDHPQLCLYDMGRFKLKLPDV